MNRTVRHTSRLHLFTQACALSLALPAAAQLIGPIPPAAPPAPAYVPGAPAPESQFDRLPPEPAAPSIIERTPGGDLRPPAATPERAAIDKYPFTPETRAKIAKSIAARDLDLDRFVITNLDEVLAAHAMRPTVESATEYAPLFEARDLVGALRHERLIDRLLRDGAINMAQRARLDEALRDYHKARSEQISKDAAADPNRTAILHLRQSFHDTTRELLDSYDAMLSDLARNFWNVKDGLGLRPDQAKTSHDMWALRTTEGPKPDLDFAFVSTSLEAEQLRRGFLARLAARHPSAK